MKRDLGLDVHVLTLPGLPEEWILQRRYTIAKAAALADFPVSVHEVEGEVGHLGRSRRRGYAQGTHPYVTHVDHDDYLRPEAFAILLPHMMAQADVITTGEQVLFENGSTANNPFQKHHLAVFRREALWPMPFERFAHYPDQFLLSRFETVHLPQCVYVHRVFPSSASRVCRRQHKEAAKHEMQLIQQPELFIVEHMTPARVADEYDRMLSDG